VKTDKGTQTLEAKNILIATGSEARMLPGLKPDARIHSDQHRDSEPDRPCRSR
jgi:dihydrolipoamide dehydrogenase